MSDNTPTTCTRKKFPKALVIFVLGFIMVWALIFGAILASFAKGVVNQNSNRDQIEIVVKDKDTIASCTRSSISCSSDFIVIADVVDDDGTTHRETFGFRGTTRDQLQDYQEMDEGERFVVVTYGEEDQVRYIDEIVEQLTG